MGLVGLLLVLASIVVLIVPSLLYLSWPLLLGAGLVVCLVALIQDKGRMFALFGLATGVLFLSTFFLARFIN